MLKFLSYPELKEKKGIPFSRPWLWRLEKEGRFPRRRAIGEKTVGWLEHEVDQWMELQADAPPCSGVPTKRGAGNAAE